MQKQQQKGSGPSVTQLTGCASPRDVFSPRSLRLFTHSGRLTTPGSMFSRVSAAATASRAAVCAS